MRIVILLLGMAFGLLPIMGLVTAIGWVTLWPLDSLIGCLSLSVAIGITGIAGISLLIYKEREAACVKPTTSS